MGTSRDERRIAGAQQFFEAALNVAQRQQDKKIAASVHMDIGVAYGLYRRSHAGQSYKSALAIYETEGDLYGQAMALYRLAVLGRTAQAFADRSLALFARVLPTVEGSGKQLDIAETFYALCTLYRIKKQYQAALDSYNRSLAIYETLPDQKSRVSNIQNLIRTTQRLTGTP